MRDTIFFIVKGSISSNNACGNVDNLVFRLKTQSIHLWTDCV